MYHLESLHINFVQAENTCSGIGFDDPRHDLSQGLRFVENQTGVSRASRGAWWTEPHPGNVFPFPQLPEGRSVEDLLQDCEVRLAFMHIQEALTSLLSRAEEGDKPLRGMYQQEEKHLQDAHVEGGQQRLGLLQEMGWGQGGGLLDANEDFDLSKRAVEGRVSFLFPGF